ncbi:MAG: cation-efflux pump [Syntrophobacterales bacterium]|nr:MAG: cation-efflux pump [Syntrophobacterales bacterium]
MDFATKFLVNLFLGKPTEPLTMEIRARYGLFQGAVSILGNIGLAILKFLLGWMTNSIALMADAFHTASDVLTSVVVVIGFWTAKKPADMEHPYGHGRIESIATLIISLLLIWVGIQFARASYDRLREPQIVTWSTVAFGLMIFSALAKEWMARFALAIGKLIQSDMLKGDAWHHRSDAIASALVAFSMIATYFGYKRIDSFFGIGIAILIMYTGFDLLRSMVSVLVGKAPSQDLINCITNAGLSVDGVEQVHDINVHEYGNHKVISLHVRIPGAMDTTRSHHLAQLVEKSVSDSLNASTVVHVDPSESTRSIPERKTVEDKLTRIIMRYPSIKGFHGLTISSIQGRPIIYLHLVIAGDVRLNESHDIGHRIINELQENLGDCQIHLHMEPK